MPALPQEETPIWTGNFCSKSEESKKLAGKFIKNSTSVKLKNVISHFKRNKLLQYW
jgi:hypothetical protein